ncbi:MAG: Asp-tRNA(Asn)/Glu-tRNA(Gln) amidotransferase subunit GatA [Candidatus Paceibacterota bacterium]|jgi:aspartyl-tRNA(Asn)/glutamyl-tRNA(Gln) amidotransferase subunit A
MDNIDLKNLTIEKAHEHLIKGDFSAKDLMESCLRVIAEKNKDINAFLEIYSDVLEQAKKADEIIKNGKATLLTGIPFAIKDNILVEGKKVSSGSKLLGDYKATYDATVTRLLKDEGAIFIGRTNMDEFAMGSSTENSAFGVTKNPHDLSRVAGGSSGGSVASVAMNSVLFALGSETGGSVRQPASFCGVVGLKPTYGAVSRYGLFSLGSSLDQIGPTAKSVSEVEVVFNVISKYDKMDSTSIPENLRNKDKKQSKKIGVIKDLMTGEGMDKEVFENFNQSLEKLKSLGYEIVDVDLPLAKYSLAVYYILMPAEASTNLSRFDGIRYGLSLDGKNSIEAYNKTRGAGFGKEARRRIILGTYVLSHGYYDAYYNKAIKVRKMIENDFKKVFESVDAIVTPTSPFPAFKIGEKVNDPLQMYLSDIFTVPANIAGIPAISIPSGMTKENLPLGIQFMAPHFGENILFKIGKEFEK